MTGGLLQCSDEFRTPGPAPGMKTFSFERSLDLGSRRGDWQ
jgi:hypothetical protein